MEDRTWKPTTAGILSIVAGVLGVIPSIILVLVGGGMAGIAAIPGIAKIFGVVGIPLEAIVGSGIISAIGGVLTAMAIPGIIIGVISVVGGTYALKRRFWGMALAGSICSLFCAWILAVPAIIFLALSKGEFK